MKHLLFIILLPISLAFQVQAAAETYYISPRGSGFNGADYGARIIKKYGTDGSHYADSGYNSLSGSNLWPFPNENRIKTDMSGSSDRGFCAGAQTLTKYIWEYLGNTLPSEIYGNAPSGESAPITGGAPAPLQRKEQQKESLLEWIKNFLKTYSNRITLNW